jgi:hypothetical protein
VPPLIVYSHPAAFFLCLAQRVVCDSKILFNSATSCVVPQRPAALDVSGGDRRRCAVVQVAASYVEKPPLCSNSPNGATMSDPYDKIKEDVAFRWK